MSIIDRFIKKYSIEPDYPYLIPTCRVANNFRFWIIGEALYQKLLLELSSTISITGFECKILGIELRVHPLIKDDSIYLSDMDTYELFEYISVCENRKNKLKKILK